MMEIIRSVYTDLIQVYGHVPGVLVCEIFYAVPLWIKSFPAKDSVSATLLLRAIINVQSIDFSNHCLLKFGEYVHTHEYGGKYMESCTPKALAIRPTGNIQGGHYLLNLHNDRVITRFTWTALLLATHICKLVRRLARQSPIALEVLDRL